MRKKFYKAVAILIAVNMMSFTVFAAESVDDLQVDTPAASPVIEDAPAEEPASDEPVGGENTDPPAEEQKNDEPAGGENTDPPAEEPKNDEPVVEEKKDDPPAEEPQNDEPVVEEKKDDPPAEESKKDEPVVEEKKDDPPAEEPKKDEPVVEEKKDDLPAEEQKQEDQKQETETIVGQDQNPDNSEDVGFRRTSENQDEIFNMDENDSEEDSSNEESSWSMDGNIEDVMGVRAGVDGDTVVIEYKTKHTDDWDYSYQNNPLTITYTGEDGKPVTKTISFDWDGNGIHGDNWSNIDGAVVSKWSDQADTEIVRMQIPASYFGSADFQISGGKYTTSVNSEGIQSSAPNSSVYTGITMDGTFNDWDAVQKTELNEPDGQHNVESVAMQIEDDYVYIYIKDDGSNSATWAGPNSNGKYAITTDLGRTLVFQLTQDGAVVGADGAISNHQGSQWEIAIPTSSLPQNNGTLSFGLYLTDPTITGSGNFGNNSSSVGIDYDGLYGDWNDVHHTEIQYATAGTHENVPDGEAAMYFDQTNGNIYGHCETRMQAHLDEQGGEYTQAVSVIVNDDWNKALQMRLATVDSAGNINWNPQKTNLEEGSYEYYIFGIDSWGSSQNISNLYDADVLYGKATITITEGRHDMEWYIDSRTLAARYGISENDVKTVSSQYGRIGQQLVTSAGASSGPWGGAVLCVMSALVPFVIKKKFIF